MNGTKRELPDTLGGRIQKLRVESNLTQGELAKIMEVKRETVNQWESETRDLKTAYTIKLANYFKVTCDYILRGIEAENVDIYEKTGLSNDAITNLSIIKSEKNDWSGIENIVLNLFISNTDFRELITDIAWASIDRTNEILYDNDEEARCFPGAAQRIFGRTVTLDPYSFYKFVIIQITEIFSNLVEKIIDEIIGNKEVNELQKVKNELIEKWESLIRKDCDASSKEEEDLYIDHLREQFKNR